MLVELNLLNHQIEFMQNYLFCVGLTETFKELTKGYKPEKHLDLLFDALCCATNFEAAKIKEISKSSLKEFKDKSSSNISKLFKEKKESNLYSSRILNLGIYIIISNSTDYENKKEIEKNELISENFKNLELSLTKAEKDIGIYKSSITKLKQAQELLEEIKIKDRKKVK